MLRVLQIACFFGFALIARADEDISISRQWNVQLAGTRYGFFEVRFGELSGGPRTYTVFVAGSKRFEVRGPVPVVLGLGVSLCLGTGWLGWKLSRKVAMQYKTHRNDAG